MNDVSSLDLLAEKATECIPNPVASFCGEGEKEAKQLSQKCSRDVPLVVAF